MSHKHAILTQGPIGWTLFKLTIPMCWGLFTIFTFNLVDTFFIAQLGTEYLSAISYTFPVTMIIANFSIGLSAGTASVVSRAIGRGDHIKVQRLATDSIVLAFVIIFSIAMVGIQTIDPLFSALGAKKHLLPLIRSYMEIWYLGVACLVVPMVCNGVLRACGDTKFPSFIMTIATLINIILDPILIFGLLGFPRLELQGAAISTVASFAIALLVSLYHIHKHKNMLTTIKRISDTIQSWKEVLYISLPAAATNMIIPLAVGFTTMLLSQFGSVAVAGYGIVTRVEGIFMIFIYALASCIAPFTGQNWGAGNIHRVRKGIHYSNIFSIAWGIIAAIILGFYSKEIPLIFDNQPDVIAVASLYFITVPWSLGVGGILLQVNSAFYALGKPLPANMLAIIRVFIFYIPLAFLGKALLGVKGIFLAVALSNIASGIISYKLLHKILGHQ